MTWTLVCYALIFANVAPNVGGSFRCSRERRITHHVHYSNATRTRLSSRCVLIASSNVAMLHDSHVFFEQAGDVQVDKSNDFMGYDPSARQPIFPLQGSVVAKQNHDERRTQKGKLNKDRVLE